MASTDLNDRKDFSQEDLIRLLAYLEGELQARDVVIATLKAEKTKLLLYQAKYGRLKNNDTLSALQRDSNAIGDASDFDEAEVSHMYETQLGQLEQLIAVQRRCHNRSKQVLAATERRHARALRELELEQERSVANAAQGDDLCALLENERTRLRQQLEYEQKESDKARKESEKLERKLIEEKERHKSMVLFLINERKQMLLKMHELRVKKDQKSSEKENSLLISEMKKEINALRMERDKLKSALCSAISDSNALKGIVRCQQKTLILKDSIIRSSTPQHVKDMLLVDCPTVVVNKGASSVKLHASDDGAPSSTRTNCKLRVSNSSSFPSSERVGSDRFHPVPRGHTASSTSPTKKYGKDGASFGIDHPSISPLLRNKQEFTPSNYDGNSAISNSISGDQFLSSLSVSYSTEPEIAQLGAVIDSMNARLLDRDAKETLMSCKLGGLEEDVGIKNFS